MPTSALFIIDIQKDLADFPETRIPHADRLVHAASQVLENARASVRSAREKGQDPQWKIIFVQHEEGKDSGALVRGTKAWELVFEPLEGEEVVAKTDRSAFDSNPDLAKNLKGLGITSIVTCGIQSDCCVVSTSQSALEEGFEVTVLKGAHSTYDCDGKTAEEIEQSVERELQEAGAKVVEWEKWSA